MPDITSGAQTSLIPPTPHSVIFWHFTGRALGDRSSEIRASHLTGIMCLSVTCYWVLLATIYPNIHRQRDRCKHINNPNYQRDAEVRYCKYDSICDAVNVVDIPYCTDYCTL